MNEDNRTTQQSLDSSQYEEASIRQYEAVYGEDFVSPGGRQLAVDTIAQLALEPGSRVLDAGCGLGGSAFVMAREFGLQVEGVDLSRNMLALARQKLESYDLAGQVELRFGDCLELEACERYHAVYSRDVFLHIADKPRLFARLHRALRPGGRLLFTDYCCGPEPWGDGFRHYVEERGYCLHTPTEYAGLIAAAGFERVEATDETARFLEILHAELARIDTLAMDETVRGKLADSWRQKIQRAQAGDQRWGLFSAVRAA